MDPLLLALLERAADGDPLAASAADRIASLDIDLSMARESADSLARRNVRLVLELENLLVRLKERGGTGRS
jgi:hypothetical protein